ncbi:MAG TPA: metalloregulator ArsR/SmtB family transcription factor [Acetobacteraceae bacterium]|nr:metalloregulator ArsR/SmtB family transcription factor [Acetobacteraceae bacterium]
MQRLLAALSTAADPTRLRLLALAGRGSFCVTDFVEVLGQSQPRLSRHLRLLCEAGLLERVREGAHCWFCLPRGEAGTLARDLLRLLPADDPILAADRRGAARVLAERTRAASATFQRQGADWDEMRALGLPARAVEEHVLALLPETGLGDALDIGTGTGRLLEVLAPRIASGTGIDASRAMLALARVRLARPDLSHCTVRQADMYALPFPAGGFDLALLHMVLHHAEDPGAVLAEAARVLRPGGRLLVVDLAPHGRDDLGLAHRWRGFSDAGIGERLAACGLAMNSPVSVAGALEVRIWSGLRPAPRQEALPPGPPPKAGGLWKPGPLYPDCDTQKPDQILLHRTPPR